MSLAVSAEAASSELKTFKNQAIKDGNDEAEVAIQIFDSPLWIPEYIDDIKEQKPMFN